MSAPTVFLSYSHDSPAHAERVRGLHASLSRDGCDCRLDVFKDTDEDWPTWMTRQLLEADFILCVVTETYARRFRDRELPDVGLGVGWEAGLIRRLLYTKKLHNDRIFPVLCAESDRPHIPLELVGYDSFPLHTPTGYPTLLRKLLNQPLHAKPATGTPPTLGTQPTAPTFPRPGEPPSQPTQHCPADLSRILKYAPAELLGREAELQLLHTAWSGDQPSTIGNPQPQPAPQTPGHNDTENRPSAIDHRPSPRPHILTFVALGGEGKTSLVAKWAAELAAQDWPGCDAAFAWSFYSQGTRDQVAASSDLFLKEALTFFATGTNDEIQEIKTFAASPAGAFEKGQRLARIVGQRRSLLLLDGLEPLQYAPTSPTPGELKDQGIAALLRALATDSHGLCVVTTRYSLPDLRAFWSAPPSPSGRGAGGEGAAREVQLLRLSRDAGVHLLKTLGLTGTAKEFETLVEDVKGHALTLTLLGGFLQRAFHGDIRQRDRVKFEKADEKMDGGHAFRTMAAYEQWLLRDGDDEGRREVAVLRLLCLFDRPADAGCLAALRREPIPGLTEPLAGLADDDWEYCLSGLEAAKLLTVNRDASGALDSLDAHPHLREYFARQLRTPQPDAWRAAHRRLYEHLCASTQEGDQPTLEDLQPLYQAVAHGCQAGFQQEAWDDVFFARVVRRNQKYSKKKLGAFGSDLGAVACFFETAWSRVSSRLTGFGPALLLDEAGFALRALGRLTEALEPMRACVEVAAKEGDFGNAGRGAGSLSELELTLGEVAAAAGNAEQSVNYADRSDDAFLRMGLRTAHADALHQAGRRAEAETRFREAEQMQAERQPDYPLLYSLQGFRYCDVLLAAPERAAWQICLESRLQAVGRGAVQSGSASSGAPVVLSVLPAKAGTPNEICRAASHRAAQTLKIAEDNHWLLDIALDHLTLGRAALYAAILEGSRRRDEADGPSTAPDLRLVTSAATELDAAVSGLRRAGQSDELPKALLTRAWQRSLTGAQTGPESAQEDLNEAWEIAERGPMKLFLADLHLHRARLFFREAKYPWTSPAADLAAAAKLIHACGCHRRDQELADAQHALLPH